MLINECEHAHQYWWNENKTPDPFKVRDIFKYHNHVHSNHKTVLVQKLFYRERGTFRITKYYGSNPNGFQWYNDANSVVQKYKGTNIYLIPPEIYPHRTLDTIYELYIIYEFSPVVSPFKNILQINIYDDKFFEP